MSYKIVVLWQFEQLVESEGLWNIGETITTDNSNVSTSSLSSHLAQLKVMMTWTRGCTEHVMCMISMFWLLKQPIQHNNGEDSSIC